MPSTYVSPRASASPPTAPPCRSTAATTVVACLLKIPLEWVVARKSTSTAHLWCKSRASVRIRYNIHIFAFSFVVCLSSLKFAMYFAKIFTLWSYFLCFITKLTIIVLTPRHHSVIANRALGISLPWYPSLCPWTKLVWWYSGSPRSRPPAVLAVLVVVLIIRYVLLCAIIICCCSFSLMR